MTEQEIKDRIEADGTLKGLFDRAVLALEEQSRVLGDEPVAKGPVNSGTGVQTVTYDVGQLLYTDEARKTYLLSLIEKELQDSADFEGAVTKMCAMHLTNG